MFSKCNLFILNLYLQPQFGEVAQTVPKCGNNIASVRGFSKKHEITDFCFFGIRAQDGSDFLWFLVYWWHLMRMNGEVAQTVRAQDS